MTSEVCLMNRQALVLAADSATTVSQWTGSEREIRYFKGANKIHQLSDYHPVGIMTFASADVLSVPWEVIVKAFRKSLADKSFNTIDGYAEEFFCFLENETKFFPVELQKEAAITVAKRAAYALAMEVRRVVGEDPAGWTDGFDAEIARMRPLIDARPLSNRLDQAWADAAVSAITEELTVSIDEFLNLPDREPRPTDFGALAELVAWILLKSPDEHWDGTGLVVAGFGDHDIFPCYVHYTSNGLFAGKHLVREVGRAAITHAIPADLSAFAQKGMIDTFQLGLDGAVYADAMDCFDQTLDRFATQIVADSGGDLAAVPDLPARKVEARSSFSTEWLARARTAHAYPLRRVLSSLPTNEMADLAETLVNLQSLKEKVTKPSEEVGGPIDVAVITKNEGLIWIRRKHFFDPALNVRYISRLGGLYR